MPNKPFDLNEIIFISSEDEENIQPVAINKQKENVNIEKNDKKSNTSEESNELVNNETLDPEGDISTEEEKEIVTTNNNKKKFLFVNDYVLLNDIPNGSIIKTKKGYGTIFYNTNKKEHWLKWFNGKKFMFNNFINHQKYILYKVVYTFDGFLHCNETTISELIVENGNGEGESIHYVRKMSQCLKGYKTRKSWLKRQKLMASLQNNNKREGNVTVGEEEKKLKERKME